jgi:hypothetical protein|tara:strand:+ start:69 stop:311 length:243 start_codon:yes stop_codon:yes gene_type:complete
MEDKKKMWTVCKCGKYFSLDEWRFPCGTIRRILESKIKENDVDVSSCSNCILNKLVYSKEEKVVEDHNLNLIYWNHHRPG